MSACMSVCLLAAVIVAISFDADCVRACVPAAAAVAYCMLTPWCIRRVSLHLCSWRRCGVLASAAARYCRLLLHVTSARIDLRWQAIAATSRVKTVEISHDRFLLYRFLCHVQQLAIQQLSLPIARRCLSLAARRCPPLAACCCSRPSLPARVFSLACYTEIRGEIVQYARRLCESAQSFVKLARSHVQKTKVRDRFCKYAAVF